MGVASAVIASTADSNGATKLAIGSTRKLADPPGQTSVPGWLSRQAPRQGPLSRCRSASVSYRSNWGYLQLALLMRALEATQ